LDLCYLGWTLQHVIDLLQLVGRFLEVGFVVRINDPWFSPTCDETPQCSNKCLSSEACDNFDVDSLCHKANKYGYVALGSLLAAG